MVRTDAADIDHSVMMVHPGNQAILVAADIEYHPAIEQNVGAVEHSLDRRRIRPGRATNHLDPGAQRQFRIAMRRLLPECPERTDRDDPHGDE